MIDTGKDKRNELHEKAKALSDEWMKKNKVKPCKEMDTESNCKLCNVHGFDL